MTAKFIGIAILVVAAFVESLAQVSLKIGAAGGSHILSFPCKRWADQFRASAAASPWISLGILLYGIQIVLWTLVLHRLDVSIAFPMDSLCFVGVAFLSAVILGETVGRQRWLGVFCILCGTVLLAM
jgi:multidrug transporter EmrE-like cation transporter